LHPSSLLCDSGSTRFDHGEEKGDFMSQASQRHAQISDLELAALISSKICHDVINPVGAIYNGIEILDEDKDDDARSYALDMIRNVTEQASARLQFARFAFGASGSAGSQIDLATAERISTGFIGTGKHKLRWHARHGFMVKDKVKLLLNLVACAPTALPRGGEIEVQVVGPLENPSFRFDCRGPSARPPQYLVDFVHGPAVPPLDAMTIQAYYTQRLAESSGMRLNISKEGADIVMQATPAH